MEVHASCAARGGAGVLLLGESGAGKSDLLLRLLDHGFDLVADDRVLIEDGIARPRPGWEGLLEVRGLGILRLRFAAEAVLRLAVRLSPAPVARLPVPARLDGLDLPVIALDPVAASAAHRVRLAMDCLSGEVGQIAGFASVPGAGLA